ncbi:hypothetical protein ACFWBB_26475 [Streptomyces sp. NPDC060000]|uniref:hypothetical protein n=1 Tax=Streptomyces sp. NPDC060000 TaxID=3347031 RepID=UPI0036A8CC23
MTRYGFAIKALPQGGKPFGEEDDENEETEGTEEAPLGEAGPGVSDTEPAEDLEDLEDELPEDPTAAPAAAEEDPAMLTEDPAAPPDPNAPPEGEGGGGEAAPGQPEDDSRPWAGDEYNEGDETDPDGPDAWCAYAGSGGEQAWLDKAPDGTLTGWVRDSDGQVWRYTDPDAWSTDVDGAQMTQTHHNGEDRASAAGEAAPTSPPPAGDRGVQDSMFAGQ